MRSEGPTLSGRLFVPSPFRRRQRVKSPSHLSPQTATPHALDASNASPLPEARWRAVKEIVHGALERALADRAKFLDVACGDDNDLRREVESLLSASEQQDDFLERPAVLIPATFQPRDEVEANELMALLADTLGTRYAFSRELGGGGMSRVFLAQELALSREVVVKVLRPDLAYGLSVERFAREVRFTARLQQANIVPLLTAGETEELPYYVMPYVRGQSLRDRLAWGAQIGTGKHSGFSRTSPGRSRTRTLKGLCTAT